MNRIRELRKQMAMTQKELAKLLKIADSTLSYWEIGKYEPDTCALIKLSRIFNVPIDYILGGDFTSWNVSEINIPYQHLGSKPVITSVVTDSIAAFNRDEFDDLTQMEIEMLAEYAEFIKFRRRNLSGRVKNG